MQEKMGMMARTTLPRLAAGLAILSPASAWGDSSPPVPAGYLGTWAARGACASAEARLVITPKTAALGTAPPAAIVYAPNDDSAGRGALHWAEEYTVDNFVLMSRTGTIIYNSQGYGMPGQVVYTRCPR